jgi:two-component system, chemotaxis family, chemotaxis protein CheY
MLRKILLVDDSALIHQMYRMALTRYKCTLIAAKNGQAGLDELAKLTDIDLVLLDINMPVMGGLEFLKRIRELGVYDHIPIVIVSTEGHEEDTKRAIALGATGYVTKPIKTRDLHAMIDRLFPSS